MKVMLLGYMGCGKSAVGRSLSKALDFDFIDLDTYLESVEGMAISEIFQKKGELYFRKKEAEAVQHWLEYKGDVVLALGGGTPCYGTVMDTIVDHADTTSIYLKASLDTLTRRLFKERAHRPLIAHLETKEALSDFIRKHLFERSYYYNRATFTIPVDEHSVAEITRLIVAQLFQ